MQHRKAFPLVELLVVVVIVGILAALLLPSFARARTTMRTATCLGNMRLVARAIAMYAMDYDRLFPGNHDPVAAAYFGGLIDQPDCNRSRKGNPYLRPQVILTPYLPNRAVWHCPQAKQEYHAAWIVPVGRNGYWLNGYIDVGPDGFAGGPCNHAFPPGWGGSVTDSFKQGTRPPWDPDPAALPMGIAPNANLTDLALSSVSSPGRYIVAGEGGFDAIVQDAFQMAYPDYRVISIFADVTTPGCCATADPVNCPWSAACGFTVEQRPRFISDPAYRRAHTRHNGGANVGFLDGHAAWLPSDRLATSVSPYFPLLEGVTTGWQGPAPRLAFQR